MRTSIGAHGMKKPVDVLQVWVIYHAFSTHMSIDVHEMIGLLLMLLGWISTVYSTSIHVSTVVHAMGARLSVVQS